jgi:hypothetical protein
MAILALTASSFAADKLALSPEQVTLSSTGAGSSVTLDAFCNHTPCSLRWFLITSNDKVGHLSNSSGPINQFEADGAQGSAIVIVQDETGVRAFSKITVLKVVTAQ